MLIPKTLPFPPMPTIQDVSENEIREKEIFIHHV